MHINVVCAVSIVSYALYLCVPNEVWTWPYAWLTEFMILVVPLMLACSVFITDPLSLLATLSIPVCLCMLVQYIKSPSAPPPVAPEDTVSNDLLAIPSDERDLLVGQALLNLNLTPSSSPSLSSANLPDYTEDTLYKRRYSVLSIKDLPYTVRTNPSHDSSLAPSSPRYSFLTVYRAYLMVITIYCILAVDFPVFPRFFAKCENWGTSLVCDAANLRWIWVWAHLCTRKALFLYPHLVNPLGLY